MPRDKLGKIPLDMEQYKCLFGTCRIPNVGKDELKFTGDERRPGHILIIRNGHVIFPCLSKSLPYFFKFLNVGIT